MAAHVLASAGVHVTVFEKRKSAGRKLLIAGSSGLNISFDCPAPELHEHYRGPSSTFREIFEVFGRADWLGFVEHLGLETFKGTSRRYFVREMKAAGLLRAWIEKLKALGVSFEFGQEAVGFEGGGPAGAPALLLAHAPEEKRTFDAIGFFLGGGSWEPDENPLRWPEFFREKSVRFMSFQPSNAGFEVDWPRSFLEEAEGLPLKGITLETSRGTREGELVVTRYGLEGTPIYAIGEPGAVFLDLKPSMSVEEITTRLAPSGKENLSPLRRIKKGLRLCPGSEALLFHLTSPSQRGDLQGLISMIKHFPLTLKGARPLAEAISSSGGLDWDEIDTTFMVKRFPGVFVGGEMLNWDAPTGGFLIQGCVSQGHFVGKSILNYLRSEARF